MGSGAGGYAPGLVQGGRTPASSDPIQQQLQQFAQQAQQNAQNAIKSIESSTDALDSGAPESAASAQPYNPVDSMGGQVSLDDANGSRYLPLPPSEDVARIEPDAEASTGSPYIPQSQANEDADVADTNDGSTEGSSSTDKAQSPPEALQQEYNTALREAAQEQPDAIAGVVPAPASADSSAPSNTPDTSNSAFDSIWNRPPTTADPDFAGSAEASTNYPEAGDGDASATSASANSPSLVTQARAWIGNQISGGKAWVAAQTAAAWTRWFPPPDPAGGPVDPIDRAAMGMIVPFGGGPGMAGAAAGILTAGGVYKGGNTFLGAFSTQFDSPFDGDAASAPASEAASQSGMP